MVFKTFKQSFQFYNDLRYKKNEYYFKGGKLGKLETRMVNTILVEKLGEIATSTCVVVEDKAITRFHPNKINNKKFWIMALKNFPLLSICGVICKNIDEVNNITLRMSKNLKIIDFLDNIIDKFETKLNVLEIGCGYGNLFYEIKDRTNYFGIDYVIHDTLKKYDNFIEIDKSGIPDFLLNEKFFDIVYCVNVLQHCSQNDRFNYFKEVFSVLKNGGYFIFTAFVMTSDNVNDACWGIKDKDGRGYTYFFNQLTECDIDSELNKCLKDIGYQIDVAKISGNMLKMIIKKP